MIQNCHIFQERAPLHNLDDLGSAFRSECLQLPIADFLIATVRLAVVVEVEIQSDGSQGLRTGEDLDNRFL